jgi:hypothetical protein
MFALRGAYLFTFYILSTFSCGLARKQFVCEKKLPWVEEKQKNNIGCENLKASARPYVYCVQPILEN